MFFSRTKWPISIKLPACKVNALPTEPLQRCDILIVKNALHNNLPESFAVCRKTNYSNSLDHYNYSATRIFF